MAPFTYAFAGGSDDSPRLPQPPTPPAEAMPPAHPMSGWISAIGIDHVEPQPYEEAIVVEVGDTLGWPCEFDAGDKIIYSVGVPIGAYVFVALQSVLAWEAGS